MKRILSLILIVVLALSLCVPAFAAGTATDTAAIDLLKGLGAVRGYPDGSLRLENNITRAEAAKVVAVSTLGADAAGKLTVSGEGVFNDVAASHWAAGVISYCAGEGIVMGDGRGDFNPEGAITCEELGAMLLRSVGYGKNGEFDGDNWDTNARAQAAKTELLKNLNMTGSAAMREEVFEGAYLALFETRVEAATGPDGSVTYAPVGGEDATLAKKLGVEVLPVGEGEVDFFINGKALGKTYALPDDELIPAANQLAVKAQVTGTLYVLLESDVGKLMTTDGRITVDRSLGGVYPNLENSFVVMDKNGRLSEVEAEHSGVADVLKGRTSMGGVDISNDTVFLVKTTWQGETSTKKYLGRSRVPTIYYAEFKEVTFDGVQYVYISNGENADSFYGEAQVFMPNPSAYGAKKSVGEGSEYYAAAGAVNDSLMEVKLESDYGDAFFGEGGTPLKPGLYRDVAYSGMFASNLGLSANPANPANPLTLDFFGELSNTPVRGVKIENGIVLLGANGEFQESLGSEGALAYAPNNLDAKVFCFEISKSGGVKSRSCTFSEISADDDAYVWGEVNNAGSLESLYIVSSGSSAWNSQWEADSPAPPAANDKVCYVNYAAETAEGTVVVRAWFLDGTTEMYAVSNPPADVQSLPGVKRYSLTGGSIALSAYTAPQSGVKYAAVTKGSVGVSKDGLVMTSAGDATLFVHRGGKTIDRYEGRQAFPALAHLCTVEDAVFYQTNGAQLTRAIILNHVESASSAPAASYTVVFGIEAVVTQQQRGAFNCTFTPVVNGEAQTYRETLEILEEALLAFINNIPQTDVYKFTVIDGVISAVESAGHYSPSP